MRKCFIVFLLTLLTLTACSNASETTTKETEITPIIDTTQFSRISSEELVEIMGEPEGIDDYEWSIPKTGQSIVGKIYYYENDKYEFLLFEDRVARLNVYSGKFLGYDDTVMKFSNKDELLAMFGIIPNSHFKKIEDTNYALRYSPVSDTVADFWVAEINGDEFGIAKITYDLNYF